MFSKLTKNKDGVQKMVYADTKQDLAEAVSDVEKQTAPESFDINHPVEEGHDMVINHADGSKTLGTAEELEKAIDSEEGVIGLSVDRLGQTAPTSGNTSNKSTTRSTSNRGENKENAELAAQEAELRGEANTDAADAKADKKVANLKK